MKTLSRFSRTGSKSIPLALILFLLATALIGTPVFAAPGITIAPAFGAEGTVTAITGSLFDSYKGDTVYVFFNNAQIEYSPFSVPDTGTFEIPFIVPSGTTPGTYAVKVTNDFDGLDKIAETTFKVESTTASIDITKGPVGTSVTVSGTGFYAGSDVTIYFTTSSPVQAGIETASDVGRFDFHYNIPACTAGVHAVTCIDTTGNQAETVFETIPVITLNSASGGPGELVKGTGTGFGADKGYSVTIGTRSVASGITDKTGSFEFGFYVPSIKANLYEVTVQDTDGHADTDKFTVTAGAALSPTMGAIGSQTTVRGDGFIPGGMVTIRFDGEIMATASADNNGGFTASFTIPMQTGGPHTVSISDGTTVKEFTYTIETTAPPAPALLLPANASLTGYGISFDWADVADDSLPVTYDLQIANDQAFTSIFLEKTGLTTSAYALSESEEPETADTMTYYWRVRANDGAQNTGDWSATWSFFMSPPDAPVLKTAAAGANGDEVLLDWQDVNSVNSPVTYLLEVSSDQAFGTTLIQATGLTTSDFAITGKDFSDLKKDTAYYWRVKAVDSASISSNWSEVSSFSIAASSSPFLPAWAIFVIAGIGVIIIAYLAFRIGRRSGGESEE